MTDQFTEGDTVQFRGHRGTVQDVREDGDSPSAWVAFEDPNLTPSWFPFGSLTRT